MTQLGVDRSMLDAMVPSDSGRDHTRTQTVHEAGESEARAATSSLLVRCESGAFDVSLDGRTRVVLGRVPECDVVIDDASVSRKHAVLVLSPEPTIEDLGSKNGTKIDGVPIVAGVPTAVPLGSVIEVGTAAVLLHRGPALVAATRADARASVRSRTEPPPVSRRQPGAAGVIVEDPAMRRLYALLEVIAPSPLAILVLGETGVGKELFGQAIHDASTRASHAFLQINCAALPESILEAELFGYEKGAFTGAVQGKAGLFESADGGTVLLDEIGELTLSIQAKLLRVLEGGHVLRLGALRPKRVDVRIVSATNRDLKALVQEQRFRADLFFRISGMTLTIPPLRARPTEIEPIARALAEATATRLGRAAPRIGAAARKALEAYAWPGNVRQLRNVMERAVVMCSGAELRPEDLLLEDELAFAGPVSAQPPPTLRSTMDRRVARGAAGSDEEKEKILAALADAGGNQSRAAKVLGISRHTLIARLAEYEIVRPRKK